MNRYPFILAAFPSLAIGVKRETSFQETMDLLEMNLSSRDKEKVSQLLLADNLDNIRAFWLGLPLSDRGRFRAKELEEALLVRDSLPPFLNDFLDRYDTTAERLNHFSSLYASLYRETIPQLEGFLKAYYEMEREIRLVLTALRAKQMGRDLVRELQFEDLTDPLVMQILAQRDSPQYTPPQEYEDLKALFVENSAEPLKLHRAILQYRFDRILEIEENFPSFSIDRILGFFARLMIVEAWDSMNRDKGLRLVDDLSKEI